MEEKVRNLINKLQAVINDTPYIGEKENAKSLLNKILKENGLTEADIIKEDIAWHYFKKPNKLKTQLLSQIIARYYSEKKQKKDIYENRITHQPCIQCTVVEFIEINARYEFFSRMFDDDMQIFIEAFIQKNNLGVLPINEEEEKAFYDKKMTDKDIKTYKMMNGMDKHNFNDQVENKPKLLEEK